jgi:uncharacterized membrane protein
MLSRVAAEALLLVMAWACALAVRPWRLLRLWQGQVPLATPFLAALTVVPWLWSWPGLAALSLPLHWSAAPLVVLLLGWPLAIPVLTVAGLSTMLTLGHPWWQALSLTVWSGVVPATLMLVLGHGVRKMFGTNPVAYLIGRAFFAPMLALGLCSLAAAWLGDGMQGPTASLQRVAMALLAMGEASWSCALVSLLVAYRPQWLATWSESMYLGQQARARASARRAVPRRP